MTVFLILAICAFFIFINRFIYRKIVSFPTIITAIWGISLALSTLGLYDTFATSDTVVFYAIIFIFGINLFSALFYSRSLKEKKTNSDTNMMISNRVLTITLIICSVLLLFALWDGLVLLLETNDFSAVRNAYINYETVGTHFQVLVSVTLIPIGKAASLLSVIDLVYSGKLKSSFVLSIIFLLLCMVMTGGRSTIFFLVLALVITLYDKENSLAKILKQYPKIIAAVVVAVIVLLIVTFQRGFVDNSVMQSIYVYFVGCFNLFGVYLDGAVTFTPLLFGQALISGVAFPFIEALRFFGVDILPGNYILAEQATSKYIPISPTVAINATPTTMFPALRDFGVAGLLVYPAVICYAFQKLKDRCQKNNNILNKALFINFLTSALLLNMAYQFGTFQIIVVFVYIIVLCKISDVYINKRMKEK